MRWKLLRPIRPVEKPLPEHTGLFWTIGKILMPLAPLAAVLLLAIPAAFVFWLLINTSPARGASDLSPLRPVGPDEILGAEWFVGALAVQLLLGLVSSRAFLLLQTCFWFGAIYYIQLSGIRVHQ